MNDDEVRELLTAIREDCSAELWSQAVRIARENRVHGAIARDNEVTMRVRVGEGPRYAQVSLWPSERDWACDCDEAADRVCVHAASAVIALHQARKVGQSLPTSTQTVATVGYRFFCDSDQLCLTRVGIVQGQNNEKGLKEKPLGASLAALVAASTQAHRSHESGIDYAVEAVDWTVEQVLGGQDGTRLAKHQVAGILAALCDHPRVTLDGKQVNVGTSFGAIRLVVEDCAAGFRLTLVQDPSVTQVFRNGAVLCGDSLRAIALPLLSARELEELKTGRVVPHEQAGELVTGMLPSLREVVPVEVRSGNLPEVSERLMPRIQIESSRSGDQLVLMAAIVYGDPAVARVDGDKLTHLQGPLPVRRPAMEERLRAQLTVEFGLIAGHQTRYGGVEAIDVASRIRSAASEAPLEVVIRGDAHSDYFHAGQLVGNVSVCGDDFDLSFTTQKGARADPSAVLRAWREGSGLVALLDGGFASLPNDFLSRYGQILSDLLAARQMCQNELPVSCLPDLAKLCDALSVERPPSFERLRVLLQDFESIPEARLPSDLRGELRPYQKKGVNWLCFMRDAGLGALLADDMGLGKTLQALCAVQGKTLVVAPTSVLHNWDAEIKRFRPSLRCNMYYGPQRVLRDDADVTLTSYALLRLDSDKLQKTQWDTLVLDEAQTIKNPDSQVSQAAYALNARFAIAMTGTPVENRIEELWSQMHAINRGFLGTRDDFDSYVAQPISLGHPGAAARLRERIRPFVLRRKKSEVAAELPPRIDTVLWCELDDQERRVYESLRGASLTKVVEQLRAGSGTMAALELLLRLRQAACHSALVPGQHADGSSKVSRLVEMLAQALQQGHKALVFSQWTSLLDRVEPLLQDQAIRFERLDGSTRNRGEVVQRFQQTDDALVLLISLKAGGVGLNLTAADHVFLLDPWWNPAVEDQAADRAHRIGQRRSVMVYKLIAKDTVEEKILALQQHKRALAEAVLQGADMETGLTRDELLALLC